MTNHPLIQLIPVGGMWRVYIDGVCRAFASTYRSAKHRADQLLAQLEAERQGGAA